MTTDGRLRVYRTEDGGKTWEVASNGLPDRAWVEVLREGMASDKEDSPGIYFGTKSGSVFVSPERGDEWIEAARLPARDPLGRSRRVAVTVLVPACSRTRPAGRRSST